MKTAGKHLVVVCGPTASGKTDLAITIARHFSTEIISADSRQFYKGLEIGTAQPSPAQLEAAPHHFTGFLNLDEKYTVADFERDALAKLDALFQQHQTVVVAGGSGLFIKAITLGFGPLPETDENLRQSLNDLFEKEGLSALQRKLQQLDPDALSIVDMQNPRRVLRALEVVISGQKPYRHFLAQKPAKRGFSVLKVGIDWQRPKLYERIDSRCDKMLETGLLEEVKTVYPKRHLNPLQTVGYKEFFPYLDGEYPLERAVELFKQHSRNLAKRQLTWFRKDPDIEWFKPSQEQGVISFIDFHI